MTDMEITQEAPPQFIGFSKPTTNFFHMPNEWTNITADIDNLAELKIVEYVLRHTWGFQEYGISKTISTDEFMYGRKRTDGTRMDRGTGLSKQSVIDGVQRAIDDGYLICTIDSADKARIKKSYILNMYTAPTEIEETQSDVKDLDSQNGCQDTRQQVSKSLTSGVKEVDSRGKESRQRSEKDTLESNFGKTPEKDTPPDVPATRAMPTSEPTMIGSWDNEKAIQYAEWWNGKVYTPRMYDIQLNAAKELHRKDKDLTLNLFKQAYDERNDEWWQEKKKGLLHVTDMKAKESSSGIVRIYAMLDRLEDKTKPQIRIQQKPQVVAQPRPQKALSREELKRQAV